MRAAGRTLHAAAQNVQSVYRLSSALAVASSHPTFPYDPSPFTRHYTPPTPSTPSPPGTHVAGTVASLTYGVAKAASIKSIKVLNSQASGLISYAIDGINKAVADCAATQASAAIKK